MIDKLDGVHPISEISERMIESINGDEIAFADGEHGASVGIAKWKDKDDSWT